MSCERYRSALMDVALGAPAPPALAVHLAECEACRAALDAERQFVGRLDAEVEASLQLPPSVGFLPRVRQRLTEPAAPRWRLAWLVPAAIGLLLVSRVLIRQPATPASASPRFPPSHALTRHRRSRGRGRSRRCGWCTLNGLPLRRQRCSSRPRNGRRCDATCVICRRAASTPPCCGWWVSSRAG